MPFFVFNAALLILAIIFCLEVGAIFCTLYKRVSTLREHLIFGLFNFSLAVMMLCRLLMMTEISSRFVALRLFQVQAVSGCCIAATFIHLTCLVTDHPAGKILTPKHIYLVAGVMAALAFAPFILHLAPPGTPPGIYDDKEIGSLFPVYATLLVSCGMMPCYLLLSTVRKLQASPTPILTSITFKTENASESEAPEIVLLRRHLSLIFRGTLVLMATMLIDILWFLYPSSDVPLHFSALGTIFLSAVTAFGLGKDVLYGERRRLNLEAVAQARLNSLSDAQHQLKNQIAAVSRPLQTAVRGLERGAERAFLEAKLVNALKETEELQETLDTMLNVARVEAGRPLDLGRKVSVHLTEMLENLCRKRASLESSPDMGRSHVVVALPNPQVFLRVAVLKQVFLNLIDNAFKYSPADSPICIRIELEGTPPVLIVRISDQGKGVVTEDHERIFNEPFYRGAADTYSMRGTGLGLNMARRYVEAMEGKLWVESEGENRGSTFVVSLPYEPDQSGQQVATDRDSGNVSGNQNP